MSMIMSMSREETVTVTVPDVHEYHVPVTPGPIYENLGHPNS